MPMQQPGRCQIQAHYTPVPCWQPWRNEAFRRLIVAQSVADLNTKDNLPGDGLFLHSLSYLCSREPNVDLIIHLMVPSEINVETQSSLIVRSRAVRGLGPAPRILLALSCLSLHTCTKSLKANEAALSAHW